MFYYLVYSTPLITVNSYIWRTMNFSVTSFSFCTNEYFSILMNQPLFLCHFFLQTVTITDLSIPILFCYGYCRDNCFSSSILPSSLSNSRCFSSSYSNIVIEITSALFFIKNSLKIFSFIHSLTDFFTASS